MAKLPALIKGLFGVGQNEILSALPSNAEELDRMLEMFAEIVTKNPTGKLARCITLLEHGAKILLHDGDQEKMKKLLATGARILPSYLGYVSMTEDLFCGIFPRESYSLTGELLKAAKASDVLHGNKNCATHLGDLLVKITATVMQGKAQFQPSFELYRSKQMGIEFSRREALRNVTYLLELLGYDEKVEIGKNREPDHRDIRIHASLDGTARVVQLQSSTGGKDYPEFNNRFFEKIIVSRSGKHPPHAIYMHNDDLIFAGPVTDLEKFLKSAGNHPIHNKGEVPAYLLEKLTECMAFLESPPEPAILKLGTGKVIEHER